MPTRSGSGYASHSMVQQPVHRHSPMVQDLTVLEIDARERVEREWQTHAAAANARELQRLDHHRQRMVPAHLLPEQG